MRRRPQNRFFVTCHRTLKLPSFKKNNTFIHTAVSQCPRPFRKKETQKRFHYDLNDLWLTVLSNSESVRTSPFSSKGTPMSKNNGTRSFGGLMVYHVAPITIVGRPNPASQKVSYFKREKHDRHNQRQTNFL